MSAKLKDFMEAAYTQINILSTIQNNYWLNNYLGKNFSKPVLVAPSPAFLVAPKISVTIESIETKVVVPFNVISKDNSISVMDYVLKALEEVYPATGNFYLYEINFKVIDFNDFFGDRVVVIRGVVHDS